MRFNMTSFVHHTLSAGTVLYSRPLELTHTVHVVYMCVVPVCAHMWVGYVCQDECGHQKLSSGVCLDCTEAGSLTGTHRSLISPASQLTSGISSLCLPGCWISGELSQVPSVYVGSKLWVSGSCSKRFTQL